MSSGQQSQKHYGITSAISLAPPREIDHHYTKKLCDAMKPFGVFEDEEELNHRWGILFFSPFTAFFNTLNTWKGLSKESQPHAQTWSEIQVTQFFSATS